MHLVLLRLDVPAQDGTSRAGPLLKGEGNEVKERGICEGETERRCGRGCNWKVKEMKKLIKENKGDRFKKLF